MSTGASSAYTMQPDPFGNGIPLPGEPTPGPTTTDPTVGGLLRCSPVPGTGSNVIDPDGNPTGDMTPGTEQQECCLPICGVSSSPGGGGFPPVPPTTIPPTGEPSTPTSPGPTIGTPSDSPSVGVGSVECGVDFYSFWASQQGGEVVPGDLRILRAVLLGSPSDEAANLATASEVSGSINPVDRLWGRSWLSLRGWAQRIDALLNGWITSTGCGSAEHVQQIGYEILLSLGKLLWGDSLRSVTVPNEYKSNALCPVCYPDVNAALDAYLRGEIEEDTWKTWTKQNNYCVPPMERVLASRQSRLTPNDLLRAWRRKLVPDADVDGEFRHLGYLDTKYTEWAKRLSEFVPPITDLIRFLVRDVEDVTDPTTGHVGVVDRFGLDSEFETKWKGLAKTWGDWQGVSDDVAKRYWRAHWQIPSPTQVFEMYHVSRSLEPTDPGYTSLEDVTAALQQQDILPYWIPRLLATTYSRLTRVDARRAYNLGVIDTNKLRSTYVRLGYRDEDADILTEWSRRERVNALSKGRLARMYRSGIISRDAFDIGLRDIGLSPTESGQVIQDVTESIRSPILKRCVTALRRRYLVGDVTIQEYRNILLRQGINPEHVDLLVEGLECEREIRGKEPSTAVLCQWYDQGLLSSEQYTSRLVQIGWSEEDALRILTQCSSRVSARLQKEADKIAKAEADRVEKMRRNAERDAARAQRAARQSARAQEIAARARARRTQQLGKATELLSQFTGATVVEAGIAVQESLSRLSADYLLTADTRVQAVVLSIEKFKPATLEEYSTHVIEIADELERMASLPNLNGS